MIVEFRVPLPFCLDNPMIGYRYMNLKACESATGGGEGVEWLVEEKYFNNSCINIVMTILMVILCAILMGFRFPETREFTRLSSN